MAIQLDLILVFLSEVMEFGFQYLRSVTMEIMLTRTDVAVVVKMKLVSTESVQKETSLLLFVMKSVVMVLDFQHSEMMEIQ